jgi:transcription elongation factor GreA
MRTVTDGEAITAQGLEALKAELARLEGDGRRAIAQRILAARELGDLKENAEYHIAKEDQAHLETRISRLAERLRNARVVEAASDGDAVSFGSTVTVADLESGRESTYTLVGATEADLRAGRLSAESPMARALMGARPGQEIAVQTPRGVRRLSVARLGA